MIIILTYSYRWAMLEGTPECWLRLPQSRLGIIQIHLILLSLLFRFDNTKENTFFLCIMLTYSYRWTAFEGRMRLNNKNKTNFILYCVRLSLPLNSVRRYSRSTIKRNKVFSFVLSSLIRTVELRSKVLSLDNTKENTFFLCIMLTYSYLCARLS